MPVILACLAGFATVLLVVGIFRPNRNNLTARRRISQFELPVLPDERAQSLGYRLFSPVLAKLGAIVLSLMPASLLARAEQKLEAAALHLTMQRFILLWAGCAAIGPVAFGLLLLLQGTGIGSKVVLALLVAIVIGFVAPWIYVSSRAKERVAVVDRSLPDVVDLIVTNIESGLALQAAMLNVATRFPGPVADEFGRVIRDTSMGRPREQAIEAMAQRIGSRDMKLFSRAVTQAERTGISIGKVLRSQAVEIRRRRRQRAREQAGKMPVKMTVLTILFMFPTLFMLLLGPVAINVMKVMAAH